MAYDADLLARFEHVLLEDRWEDRLHEAFRAAGIRLTHRPDIEVAHKMHYRSAFEYAGQRFLYSRAYAAMRVRDRGGPGRWLYGCGALLLPPLLLYRVVRNGWSTPRLRGDMMRALPLLALFVTSWAAGEIVGALAGPGNALGRVR